MNDLYMRMNEINDEESLKEEKERLVESHQLFNNFSDDKDVDLAYEIFHMVNKTYPILYKWTSYLKYSGAKKLESIISSFVMEIKKTIPSAEAEIKGEEGEYANWKKDFFARVDDDIKRFEGDKDSYDGEEDRELQINVLKRLKDIL